MKYGIDALALAKYKSVIIRYMPKGWGIGVFAKVDGFGDGLTALSEVLAKRSDIPFVRVQLAWRDDHNFTSRDYRMVKEQAARLLPIIQKYPTKDWFVSPTCEDKLNESNWKKFGSIVSYELRSVPFNLVHSPIKTGKFSGVINEYHHEKGGDAYSYDGSNCFDSDVEGDKSSYKDSPYYFFWCPQCNGNRKVFKPGDKRGPLDFKERNKRVFWLIKEQVESMAALAGLRGAISIAVPKLIWKSHSDQHTPKPSGKDCKPVVITPLNVRPEILQLKKNGRVVSTSSRKQPYNEKKPDGTNGRQVGWRYYFPKWGYQISTSPLELWGGRKKLAVVNPAFRCFNYR